MSILLKIWAVIKSFFKKIWDFLTSLSPSILALLLMLAVVFSVLTAIKCSKLEKEKNKIVYVMNDTIEQYKNKANEEYAAKNTYIMEVADLKAVNKELSDEVKKLKDSPLVVTKTEIVYVHDTIYTKIDSVVKDDEYKLYHWSAKDSTFLEIAGVAEIRDNGNEFSNVVTETKISANLTVDLIEKDNQFKTIVKSDNPYIIINDINSVVLDPKKSEVLKSYFKPKRFGIGPYVGASLRSNPTTGQLYVGPSIGIALHYDIVQF